MEVGDLSRSKGDGDSFMESAGSTFDDVVEGKCSLAHDRLTLITCVCQWVVAGQLLYMPLITFIKVSILLFFLRIFSANKTVRWGAWGGIIIISLAYLVLFFRTVFICQPIQKAWSPATPGHCVKRGVIPYTAGGINVISDIYILLLPIPCIYGLNLKRSRKWKVMAVFSVGLLYLFPHASSLRMKC